MLFNIELLKAWAGRRVWAHKGVLCAAIWPVNGTQSSAHTAWLTRNLLRSSTAGVTVQLLGWNLFASKQRGYFYFLCLSLKFCLH